MTNKKNLLMLLLVLCLGLPLQMQNVGNMDHPETMTACINGDTDGDPGPHVCDATHCLMPAGSCAAHNITSISQQSPWTVMAPISPGGYFALDYSWYRSRLNFSIYRPPIA
ncbi:hypothetical protein N8198_07880 [Gammaproteobacteria bacterium]|nr:hypothetical protein [Gammaproteobacteria bacterium]